MASEHLSFGSLVQFAEDYFASNFEAFLGGFFGVFFALVMLTIFSMICARDCLNRIQADLVSEKEDEAGIVKSGQGLKPKNLANPQVEKLIKEHAAEARQCIEGLRKRNKKPESGTLSRKSNSPTPPSSRKSSPPTVKKFIVPDHIKRRNAQFREMLAEKQRMLEENTRIQDTRRAIMCWYLKQKISEGISQVAMMSYKVYYPKDFPVDKRPVVLFHNKLQEMIYVMNLSNTSHTLDATENIFKTRVGNTFTKNHLGTYYKIPKGSIESAEHAEGLKLLIRGLEPNEITTIPVKLIERIRLLEKCVNA